jgi:hypothetical protein
MADAIYWDTSALRKLRSLDGMHLGALRAARIQSVVTADVRMRDAARIAGMGVIEP